MCPLDWQKLRSMKITDVGNDVNLKELRYFLKEVKVEIIGITLENNFSLAYKIEYFYICAGHSNSTLRYCS